jgi:hypothetical protein
MFGWGGGLGLVRARQAQANYLYSVLCTLYFLLCFLGLLQATTIAVAKLRWLNCAHHRHRCQDLAHTLAINLTRNCNSSSSHHHSSFRPLHYYTPLLWLAQAQITRVE